MKNSEDKMKEVSQKVEQKAKIAKTGRKRLRDEEIWKSSLVGRPSE